MPLKSVLTIVAAACLAAALPARAGIFRCTGADGAVSYQQAPCQASEAARVLDVPETYPAADPKERERLFQREAALDARLEAEREREAREAIARASQPAAPPDSAQDEAPQPPLLWLIPASRGGSHGGRHPRRPGGQRG